MKPPNDPKKLGIWTVTALVVGGMIGSGIFSIPIALAPYGGIGVMGWLVAATGALVLARIFGRLSKVIPATGGPYAYSRMAFGDLIGFFVAWGYWISVWTTNAAITITFISYLSVFIPALRESTVLAGVTGLFTLWLLTAINSNSVKAGGRLQLLSTILKILPILIVTLGGIFFFNADHFIPFNTSDRSGLAAVTVTTALCLFAFMGLETATIPAGNIRSPEKTIPKATLIGTSLVVLIYIMSSVSLFGILPPDEVAVSLAPFSDAAAAMWGDNARYLVAAGACLSTFGALNCWILIQGQVPMAMARDRLLPRLFARTNKNDTPAFGILVSSVIVTLLLLLNQTKGLSTLYAFMILLTAVTLLMSYLFSSLAYAFFALKGRYGFKPTSGTLLLALIGVGFSLWMIIGSGKEAVFWGFAGILGGIPVYWWNKRRPNA